MIHFERYKEKTIEGRYVTLKSLQKTWLNTLDSSLVETIGSSVLGNAIFSINLGSGPKKVLMWSQMHGNESTTTKAVLDLVNCLVAGGACGESILENCTLCIVPILNPDGAAAYTRVNANEVDLNRDAKNRTQPESVVLRELFERFQPDFCFNLHDQRTLFSAGKADKPATVSFLSPSNNPERTVDQTRTVAMQLIVAMNRMLQDQIPGQVGRYDDGFNENCIGDTFQMLGVPTILFEAGHFQEDYQREDTRKYIFMALLEVLGVISKNRITDFSHQEYFDIPENEKLFFDILIRNAHLINESLPVNHQVGIRFVETLKNGAIDFVPEVAEVGELAASFGHSNLDCSISGHMERIERKNLLPLIQNIKS
ncbi:M14 family metallopeptidase [Flagellimonas flava]|uniref:M14 family metallopeptidase n=1 Tax=Flagellimonas flava TaxID=570519 RepID=UPI003D660F5B